MKVARKLIVDWQNIATEQFKWVRTDLQHLMSGNGNVRRQRPIGIVGFLRWESKLISINSLA